MTDLRQAAIDVLSSFTGYPDLPNGRPCGVWAYMIANRTSAVVFAQGADGRVRRLGPAETAARDDVTHVIDVPWLDPGSPDPKRLYYAAIETDPAGVLVITLPKGTQDVLARRGDVCTRIELGQKRQLVELLQRFDAEPDLRAFDVIGDASTRQGSRAGAAARAGDRGALDSRIRRGGRDHVRGGGPRDEGRARL